MTTFRSSFGVQAAKSALNWFPKHMNSGLKQMQAKLRTVDCVLELHDARIPLTGRHLNYSYQLIGNKPHILLLNKCDLISGSDMAKISKTYEYSNVNSLIFTNCKNDKCEGIRKLVPTIRKLVEGSEKYGGRAQLKEYHAMIIGIPNVGKSSLINVLRSKYLKKGRAVQVGPSAGVTKCVHEKVKICESPLMYLFDTPGILAPKANDVDSAMKLAICGNLPDAQVGEILIADYLLYTLNRKKCFDYVKFLDLRGPTDCITTALSAGAVKMGYIQKRLSTVGRDYQQKPDLHLVAQKFILAYRKGEIGKAVIDDIVIMRGKKTIQFKERSNLDLVNELDEEQSSKMMKV